ncbi:hypothetical protein [Natronorarus salvus]
MTRETAACVGCGEETPIEEEEVASPVCYRPLCSTCREETV